MRLFIVFVLLASLFGCQSKTIVWQEQHHPADQIWDADSVYKFTFDVTDTSGFYNLYIETVNTKDYPFSNIWFFTKMVVNNQKEITDTLEYDLCNDVGAWYGKKQDHSYTIWNLYQRNVRFAQPGKYTFFIQQGTRKLQLSGISAVGLIIQKQETKQ
jgi:gliding motility-associated lipoprotein GldH